MCCTRMIKLGCFDFAVLFEVLFADVRKPCLRLVRSIRLNAVAMPVPGKSFENGNGCPDIRHAEKEDMFLE